MGLGKTRQSIVSLRHLTPGGCRLVVCPGIGQAQLGARDRHRRRRHSDVLVIDGTAPASPTAEWVIVNYDILGRHLDQLLRVPWAALVFDEAHYLKNHTSARSKLARQLTAAAAAATRTLVVQLLTGTPLTSRPRDLFVLLQLAAHPLGRSFLAFAKRYCAAEKGEYGWKTGGASNIEELTVQLHGVMLRRSKDDVLSLPPKLRTWLPVEVPAGHRRAGDQEGLRAARAAKTAGRRRRGTSRCAGAASCSPFWWKHGRRSRLPRPPPRSTSSGARLIRARRSSCFRASTARFRSSPASWAPRPSS